MRAFPLIFLFLATPSVYGDDTPDCDELDPLNRPPWCDSKKGDDSADNQNKDKEKATSDDNDPQQGQGSGGWGNENRGNVRDHRSGSSSNSNDGTWGDATGAAEDAGSSVGSWFTTIMGSAQTAMESGDFETAESYGMQLTEKDPNNPLGWRIAAMAQGKQGDKAEALATVESGLQYSPNDDGLQGLQKIYSSDATGGREFDMSQIGKKKAKRDYGKTGPKPRPGSNQVAKAGGAEKMLPAQMSKHSRPMQFFKPEAHSGYTRRGLEKMQANNLIGGIKEFTKAIRKDKNNAAALRWRALAREKAGDHEGALQDASRALALNPKDHWALKTQALALLALKKAEEALAAANKAIEANGTDADAFRTRAMIQKALGDKAAMIQDLAQAASLDPAFQGLYRRELAKVEKENAAEDDEENEGGDSTMGTVIGLGALILGGGLAMAFSKKKGAPANTQTKAPLGVTGFDITGKLGQGGMGEVWEATDRALERRVAIKRLRAEIAGDARMRKKFLKEARIVAGLKHPNIVEIHSVIEEGDELLLVFEHIDGQPLDAILGEHGKLTLPQTIEIVKQTAAALDYAHQQGVIHQDLKPGNIMIAGEKIKVMDFGIARRVAEDLSTLSSQEVSGTPLYMAPEQHKSDPRPQSDVYALGLCFYEMLTGTRAKPAQGFAPLTTLVPGIAPGLDGVLAYTFDPDPTKRYQSAGQLASAIEQVVNASPAS